MNCGSLYGVYDRKAEYFVNVFVSSNDETAKRSFENLFFTVEDTVFNLCKNDFTLAKICDLGDLPPCNGNSIPVKPMPIYLAADISEHLIRQRREDSFINFMKAKAKMTSFESESSGTLFKKYSESQPYAVVNDTTGQKS